MTGRGGENHAAFIHPSVRVGRGVSIGHGSLIGYGPAQNEITVLGDNVEVGAFCIVYFGAVLEANSSLDDYGKVCRGSRVGEHTKVLYGKHVYEDATIGSRCIIGGHVADRTIIEDDVTYLGEIAHSHRDASLDWDETEEESPVIYRGSVIGANALIIGPRRIGPCAYVAAGEIVRTDVGEGMIACKGEIRSLEAYRGLFKARC